MSTTEPGMKIAYRVVTNIVFLIRESVGAQANTHYVSGNCDAAPLVRLICSAASTYGEYSAQGNHFTEIRVLVYLL